MTLNTSLHVIMGLSVQYLLVTVFVTSMTSLSKYIDEWKDLSQVKQQRIAQVCVF